MSKGYAAGPLAAAQQPDRAERQAVAIVTPTTTKYYISGRDPVSISGNVHRARSFSFDSVAAAEPGASGTRLTVSNLPDTGDSNYQISSEDITGKTVTTYRLVWDDGAYVTVDAHVWTCVGMSGDQSEVVLELSAWGGMARTAALCEGSRYCPLWFKGTFCAYGGVTARCDRSVTACAAMGGGTNVANRAGFMYAPEAGESISFGTGSTTVGAAPPAYRPPVTDPLIVPTIIEANGPVALPTKRKDQIRYWTPDSGIAGPSGDIPQGQYE